MENESIAKECSIHVFGGGTSFYVRPNLVLSAPSRGTTARQIARILEKKGEKFRLHLTRMAGGGAALDTNKDVESRLSKVVSFPDTKLVFLSTALCAWEGSIRTLQGGLPVGKQHPPIPTNKGSVNLLLNPAENLAKKIREIRKDLILVGFRSTSGASLAEQRKASMDSLRCYDIVLCNDYITQQNLIVAEGRELYGTKDRQNALKGLIEASLFFR